jgi:hypothetical protein
MKRTFSILVAFFIWISSSGQTLQDWANTVHWDGVTYWSKYIVMLPGKMGPNSIPIPQTANGTIDNSNWVAVSGQFHSRSGENAQTILLTGNYTLVKDVISFGASYIPAEYYKMSDTLKRERHVYYQFWNDRKARGDVLLNINIKLMKKWDRHIHLALQLGYRYPSSNGLGAARFTDNMGYYFNLSASKPIGNSHLNWIGMGGFYCWQIDKDDLRQDDAFLFGTGFQWSDSRWKLETTVAGYIGYLESQGDKPVVYRAYLERTLHNTGILFHFQQGLKDYRYTTFEFGLKQHFGNVKAGRQQLK